jgi:hypothetical protein
MLLIVICLTRANLKIRTYPDFNLGITGFLMEEMSVFSGRRAGQALGQLAKKLWWEEKWMDSRLSCQNRNLSKKSVN